MTLKEKFEAITGRDFDRAVSPVIGVILMVAITVILAAVIGTFVMGMGNNVQQNANAGVSFDEVNDSHVDVQLTSLGNVDEPGDITVTASNCDGVTNGTANQSSLSYNNVGEILTAGACSSGDKITVKANISGSTNVVATHEVN